MSISSTSRLSVLILEYLRHEKGYNLREIGELIGLSESFMSRVANGERSLTLNHLDQLEQSLNEPLVALMMESMLRDRVSQERKSEFENALQLVRDIGQFRQTLATVDADDSADARPDSIAKSRGSKRAAG